MDRVTGIYIYLAKTALNIDLIPKWETIRYSLPAWETRYCIRMLKNPCFFVFTVILFKIIDL